jgi:Kef-type K+ transport system membrane component KefB
LANPILDVLLLVIIIVLGFISGKLIQRVKLPMVLGFLIVGMLIGPFALGVIDEGFYSSPTVRFVALIAIGLVGYSIGSHIHKETMKKAGARILVIGLLESFTPFLFVTLAMYFLLGFDIYASLIAGSVALATAPAVALSMIDEYRTRGPVTDTLLLVVVIDDVIAVVTFGVVMAFAGAFYQGEELSFVEPFLAIAESLILGAAMGFLAYYPIRKLRSKWGMRAGLVVAVLTTMGLAYFLGIELFLTGVFFGMMLFNRFNNEQRQAFEDSNKVLIGISIIFFLVLIGTTLDLAALVSAAALAGALIYIISRGVGKILGASAGARLVKADPLVTKYLGFTLLAAAGVSLSFIGIAITILPPEEAAQLGGIIGAAAIINELIAVFATKWAFKKSNEMMVGVTSPASPSDRSEHGGSLG